jgi:hypothetical protein
MNVEIEGTRPAVLPAIDATADTAAVDAAAIAVGAAEAAAAGAPGSPRTTPAMILSDELLAAGWGVGGRKWEAWRALVQEAALGAG